MLVLSVIGNVAADAELSNINGTEYLKFTVGVSKRVRNNDGSMGEETWWVNVISRHTKIAQYIKRGGKVYVEGDMNISIYSSEKYRKMMPSIDVFADRIELCGSRLIDNQQNG